MQRATLRREIVNMDGNFFKIKTSNVLEESFHASIHLSCGMANVLLSDRSNRAIYVSFQRDF